MRLRLRYERSTRQIELIERDGGGEEAKGNQ